MKRVWASVPDKVFDELEEWSQEEGRSQSNLVSSLLEMACRARKGEVIYLTKNEGQKP